jgi:hypothetical protein
MDGEREAVLMGGWSVESAEEAASLSQSEMPNTSSASSASSSSTHPSMRWVLLVT